MFGKEFYPTPVHVLDRMQIDCDGKIVLEPSAGKGDIVNYLHTNGAKRVYTCEINQDLKQIVGQKSNFIRNDFFEVTAEMVSDVQVIVMNPPFSYAHKHILHAWAIAPQGCEIVALCNYNMIGSSRGYGRSELGSLLYDYGTSENLGDVFGWGAERTTQVEIGLIRLFKPIEDYSKNWDGFYYDDEKYEGGAPGVMVYTDVKAIVNSYVASVKMFDEVLEVARELNKLTSVVNFSGGFVCQIRRDETTMDRDTFAKELQMQSWRHIFSILKIDKMVTKGVMEDINKFISQRSAYPFTVRNVYRMIEILVGTWGNTMDRAIVEAIDNFTKYTHENRYGVEGWKTNEGHMLNKKFIIDYVSEPVYGGGLKFRTYNSRAEKMIDLIKAICYIVGDDYENQIPLYRLHDKENIERCEPGKWYEWGYFRFKLFKKGTAHFEFKDLKIWEQLNRRYAKIKGEVLPEKL